MIVNSSNTISSILHTKSLISNKNFHVFEITKEIRKRMNTEMYKKISTKIADSSDGDDEAAD